MHEFEKCKISYFKFSKVMQQHTEGVVGNLIWIITGSIARSATCRYLIYSEASFDVFAPHGRHVAPIWMKFGMEEGGLPNFTPIGAMVRV